jgi:hypothetical protein
LKGGGENMTRRLQLIWYGFSPLSDEGIEKCHTENKGVYRLSFQGSDGKLHPFYVGQGEIKNRLKNHLYEESNSCIKNIVNQYNCFYKYAVISGLLDRNGAEKALYNNFKPKCNDSNAIPNEPNLEINYN